MISRTFQARLSELDEMMTWVRKTLLTTKLAQAEEKKFEIAIEEALINIIQHAYPNLSGLIEIVCRLDQGEITLILSDQGIPFNPLQSGHELDLTSGLSERKIGGLGLHFMHQMTDHLSYRREGDTNILVMSKSIR